MIVFVRVLKFTSCHGYINQGMDTQGFSLNYEMFKKEIKKKKIKKKS